MMKPFSYCVLRYFDNPASGEWANVGVLLFSPNDPLLLLQTCAANLRIGRFFPAFDSAAHALWTSDLHVAAAVLRCDMCHSREKLWKRFCFNAGDCARTLMPDNGLSYQFGDVGAGLCEIAVVELDRLFARFVGDAL